MAEGPIWIDMTEQLMALPVGQLVYLTSVALNTMDARTLAGVCFDAGLRCNLDIKEKDNG